MMRFPLLKCSTGIWLSTWPLLLTTPFDPGSGGFGPSGVLDHNSLYATAGRAPGGLSLGGFGAAASDYGDLQVHQSRLARCSAAAVTFGMLGFLVDQLN